MALVGDADPPRERRFEGVEKLVNVRGGELTVMREYSNQLGLSLLKMHRDSVADAKFKCRPKS
ncbi:MAG: hypothetical protein ABIQ32_06840 [Sphingomicrobium sp.]